MVVFRDSSQDWGLLLALLSVLSMVAGNLIALAQPSFKRMLAYSSIAHVGYILIGFVAATQMNNAQQMEKGLSSIVFYVVVYGVMNLGAFAGAILFSNETGSDLIDDYAGLIRKRPILALLLSVCLINLAGLPIPPAGFLAKVFIFTAGFSSPLFVFGLPIGPLLVAVALLTTIPAIFYYTRVVIKMIAQEPSQVVSSMPAHLSQNDADGQFGLRLALVSCAVIILAAGTVMVDPIMNLAHNAIEPILLAGPRSSAG
jgi:NAD(P)H-quinone oxidoreductase subunit 2